MLTPKQSQTYQFIRTYLAQYGYAPTMAEIAAHLGIQSRGLAHRYVSQLAEAGYLSITPGKKRNLTLLRNEATELPVLGYIAAGIPIEAISQPQVLNIEHYLLGAKRYVLRVKGNSMIGDNICDGDYIICEQADCAPSGAIVVALIDQQETTLKRLHNNQDGTVTLIPSNPQLSPLVYAAEQVSVQGVYIGLLRLAD